jgi:serine/threonine-protein kinase
VIRTLEKYELLEEIGHGGMATVFRARDTKLDRLVALKLMHPHLRGAKEARARFRREAQSVARLRHPRILEIYDYSGEGSEESYIAAELLTGPTLKVFVEQGDELPAEIAACFGIEIARALAAAHDKGIIHRDVKPENILLHENRCLKLTDFGIADMVDSQSMTATGQILGSPGHMAPEQIDGHETDARTDVFALGTVLYFLAVGRLPFTGKNPHQILKRILDGEIPDPLRFRPAVGGRLRAILLKSMAKVPADRYQSAAELEAALRAFVAEIGIDDPERQVAAYLADPRGVRADVDKRVVARYTELGKRALADGRALEASDCFARVLAIDETNAEVLALVDRIGRAADRVASARRLVAIAGAGIAAALLGWGGWALLASPTGPRVGAGEAASASRDASTLPDAAADAGSETDVAASAAPTPEDAALEPDAGPDAGLDAAAGFEVTLRPIQRPDRVAAPPRRVVFSPDPQNVQIAVDDQPLRPYGPSFESIELVPGRHRFRFVSNVDCCADATIERDIPPGTTPFTVAHVLPSRPAILIVRTNVPADVAVEPGLAAGRARMAIDVPITSPTRSEHRTITVTAPGHRAYTGDVLLSAGAVTTHQVVLEPLQEESPGSAVPTAPGGGE